MSITGGVDFSLFAVTSLDMFMRFLLVPMPLLFYFFPPV